MTVKIAGAEYTGFPGFDSNRLPTLDHAGRLEWLKYRFQLVFLTPFKAFVRLDANNVYIWLCIVNLLCAAVEALADFQFDGTGMERFSGFVEEYFRADFRAPIALDEPRPVNTPAVTPAQHLYRYFRCGLAHSFCIEWGGLRHREDGAPSYLFQRNPVGNLNSLGIVPRELVEDFLNAVDAFFRAAAEWEPGLHQHEVFNRRFESVFLVCAPPGP